MQCYLASFHLVSYLRDHYNYNNLLLLKSTSIIIKCQYQNMTVATHPHHHQRRRRSVTFSETSQQILVRDLSNISEKDTLWYSAEDLIASKANLLYCKEKVRESISKRQTPSASSILGVEKYLTEQLTLEYMNRRHMLRKRVLDEARWQEMIIRSQQQRHRRKLQFSIPRCPEASHTHAKRNP